MFPDLNDRGITLGYMHIAKDAGIDVSKVIFTGKGMAKGSMWFDMMVCGSVAYFDKGTVESLSKRNYPDSA